MSDSDDELSCVNCGRPFHKYSKYDDDFCSVDCEKAHGTTEWNKSLIKRIEELEKRNKLFEERLSKLESLKQ